MGDREGGLREQGGRLRWRQLGRTLWEVGGSWGGLWGGRTVTWDQTPQGLGWLGGPVRTGPLPKVGDNAWGQLALRADAPAHPHPHPHPHTWKNSGPGLRGRRRGPTFPLQGAAPQGRPSAELQTLVNLLCSHLSLGPASASHPLSRGPRALPEPGIKYRERWGTPGPAGGGGAPNCLSPRCSPGLEVGSGAGELWLRAGEQAGEMMGPQVSDSGLSCGWGEANGSPSAQRLAETRRAQSAEGPLCGPQGHLQALVPPAHRQGD